MKRHGPEMPPPADLYFGRSICNEYVPAARREWLVTNGIGGYASGTVCGAITRRYHGLLIAALKPPLGRTLLVSKLDETVQYRGRQTALFTNRWSESVVEPEGYIHLREFRLSGGVPVWIYEIADALLEKVIWMEAGADTTYVRYRLLRAGTSLVLRVGVFVNGRDHHANTHANGWSMALEQIPDGIRIAPSNGIKTFAIHMPEAQWSLRHDWTRGYYLEAEAFRGLDAQDDHLRAAETYLELQPGQAAVIVCTAEEARPFDVGQAFERRSSHITGLLRQASTVIEGEPPDWVKQLILAADQFIVRRGSGQGREGSTVLAGYPWFGDWGRDTMISLRGLALATGRFEVLRTVLRTYAQFVDRGMLPNHFPESGERAEYNTVDATLWYFEALRAYTEATGDQNLVEELFPTLTEIIDWHVRGTRHGIRVDTADGLLAAGEAGLQLTWMDAKVGDWVVTPRIGKPVEVNALWHRSLLTMAAFADILGVQGETYRDQARAAQHSFQKFWNPDLRYCFDVIEGPDGDDASLRPNQLFAISLGGDLLTDEQARAVVEACARSLYTSAGLRSLAPDDPSYVGTYGGDQKSRDGAYHQGTVWAWLIGPFVEAHYRVYRDYEAALQFLAPAAQNLLDHGLGSISEIFEGDPPHRPRGCIAQAWSVAELLRAWRLLQPDRSS